MNNIQTVKIQKFLADEMMSSSVKSVLESFCLAKSKDRDVHNLAARFLAIEILEDAWKELEKSRQVSENEKGITKANYV